MLQVINEDEANYFSRQQPEMTEVAENGTNGHHNGHRETEEERRIRKERERKARENETEEERRIRKVSGLISFILIFCKACKPRDCHMRSQVLVFVN